MCSGCRYLNENLMGIVSLNIASIGPHPQTGGGPGDTVGNSLTTESNAT